MVARPPVFKKRGVWLKAWHAIKLEQSEEGIRLTISPIIGPQSTQKLTATALPPRVAAGPETEFRWQGTFWLAEE